MGIRFCFLSVRRACHTGTACEWRLRSECCSSCIQSRAAPHAGEAAQCRSVLRKMEWERGYLDVQSPGRLVRHRHHGLAAGCWLLASVKQRR